MFEAEDLLSEGKAGELRYRPQLGSASGGCLLCPGTLSPLHPCVRARIVHCQHRVSPNIGTLSLSSHLWPRQETSARPKAGPRSTSLGQGKCFEMCPEFLSPCPSLLTLLTDIWTQLFKQELRAGCAKAEELWTH